MFEMIHITARHPERIDSCGESQSGSRNIADAVWMVESIIKNPFIAMANVGSDRRK